MRTSCCNRLLVLGPMVMLLAVCWAGRAAPAPKLPPLTTIEDSPRLPGKFVWADLVTDDVIGARKFYAKLFGWKFQDLGAYSIGYRQEEPICGMFQRERPKDRSAEPRWFSYISVPSVGKTERAVKQAGGRVLAPAKRMPKRGEQAVFADAEGAVFGVVKSSSGDPPDYLAEPGDWIWIQLLSRDAKKASEFYGSVAGYEAIAVTDGEKQNEFVLTSEGYARATVRTIASNDSSVKPTWLPYIRVNNVQETLTEAKKLGGKVLIQPNPKMLGGKVAVIADPTGAAMGLMEWSPELMKGGR